MACERVQIGTPSLRRWIAIGVMGALLFVLVAGLYSEKSVYGMHHTTALLLVLLLGCALMLTLGWPRKE